MRSARPIATDDLVDEVDIFLESLERAQYRALAGLSDDPGLAAIYDRHPRLFEVETFERIEPGGDEAGPRSRRACLREFLAGAIEGHRTRELQDRALSVEATTTAEVDGEEIPYRTLPIRIRREDDRDRRARFDAARLEVVSDRLNPIHLEALETAHGVARELLDRDYDDSCAHLAGLDFDALEERVERLLDETRDTHRDLLGFYVRRRLPGVRIDEMKTHDLQRLLYGAGFSDRFPAERMLPRIRWVVEAMGLELTAGGRIEIDLEDRPSKAPRAFCSAVRVPHEVKLVLRPYGGLDDYVTFLHELGHALHFAHVDPDQPMEFRRLGDNGVTEGFAMTFDHLMQLGPFLIGALGYDDPEEFLLFTAFRELVMLRRYAAKFRYERSLHRHGPGPDRAAEYVERLTDATGARASATLYLEDVDPRYYCVRYLRAWMFAGALHRVLRERFDEDWFVNPRSGPFLEELWALGQGLPVEALAREHLGVDELTFGPLLQMVYEKI